MSTDGIKRDLHNGMEKAIQIEIKNSQGVALTDAIYLSGVGVKRFIYYLVPIDDVKEHKRSWFVVSAMKKVARDFNEKRENSALIFLEHRFIVDEREYKVTIMQPIFSRIYQEVKNKDGKLLCRALTVDESIDMIIKAINDIFTAEENRLEEVKQVESANKESKEKEDRASIRNSRQKSAEMVIGNKKIGIVPILLQDPINPNNFVVAARFEGQVFSSPYRYACLNVDTEIEHETFIPNRKALSDFNGINVYTYFINTNRKNMEILMKNLLEIYIQAIIQK